MKYVKFLTTLSVLFAISNFLGSREIEASEGYVELKSTLGEKSRCYAASVLMRDLNYNIVLSCRDIIYPGNPNEFNYLVWASPKTGGLPIKLGELGVGKAFFRTPIEFTSLYVTREKDVKAASPSQNVALGGVVQPITFLEGTYTPQPTTANQESEGGEKFTPPTPSTQESILASLKKAGLIFGSVIVLIVLVVIITRR